MSDKLNKATVLVLNRNWQAINVRTPMEALCQMATSVATALEIEGENQIRPVTWNEWITLPIREQDQAVLTARGPITYSGFAPDRITVFQGPLCLLARDRADLEQSVRTTVLHEVGHYFGMSDDRLRELGWA